MLWCSTPKEHLGSFVMYSLCIKDVLLKCDYSETGALTLLATEFCSPPLCERDSNLEPRRDHRGTHCLTNRALNTQSFEACSHPCWPVCVAIFLAERYSQRPMPVWVPLVCSCLTSCPVQRSSRISQGVQSGGHRKDHQTASLRNHSAVHRIRIALRYMVYTAIGVKHHRKYSCVWVQRSAVGYALWPKACCACSEILHHYSISQYLTTVVRYYISVA
jgi:hypothetical protein